MSKTPKQKPCPDGDHTEIIQHPDVPPEEEDPKARVEAMRRAGTNPHEINAALHNIADGSITSGRQISRDLTPEEVSERRNGDEQKIWARCTVCHASRELDQAPADDSLVEAKKLRSGWGEPHQRANNLAFAREGGRVTYKLPVFQANGAKGQAIREAFRGIGAQRGLTIIPIG